MRIQYVGQSSRAKSVNANDLRCVNAYTEVYENRQGKRALCIYRTPCLRLWQTLSGAGPVRGLWYAASVDRAFAVQGATLWEIMADATHQFRGNILTTEGPID